MRFSTNSLGYRGTEPIPVPGKTILILGDSFAMGYGVNDGAEFPALVGKMLAEQPRQKNLKIFNAAVGNTAQGRWIKFLNREARRLNPEMVILEVCLINDFSDNEEEGLFHLGQKEELVENTNPPRKGRSWAIQKIINAVPGVPYLRSIALLRQIKSPWQRSWGHEIYEGANGEKNRSIARRHDRLTYALLRESVSLCQKSNWPVVAVLVSDDPWILGAERLKQTHSLFQELNVPVVEIPSFQRRPDLYYRQDRHWNAKGHAYAAQEIFPRVREIIDGLVK